MLSAEAITGRAEQTGTGLTSEEAATRLLRFGYNELPASKPRSIWHIIAEVLKEPMVLLLLICGTLYLILGDLQEGILLLVSILAILVISFYQGHKTERALDALKVLASPRTMVLRDGMELSIAASEVVPGDIIFIKEGDRIAADASLLRSLNLSVDESLLTGESLPVSKQASLPQSEGTKTDEMARVFSGSMAVQGSGMARVTATGSGTKLGAIGRSLNEIKTEKTLLQMEIALLTKRIWIIGASVCIVVVLAWYLTRGSLIDGFLAGLSLAMAAMPEELPVALTVFIALGAWRLSKKQVLARNPVGIETLGAVTTLCVDKTGTITENRMSVSVLYTDGQFHHVKEDGGQVPDPFRRVIWYGALASRPDPFDPMEKAINHLNVSNPSHAPYSQDDFVKEYPLSPELLIMSRVYKGLSPSNFIVASKGAPEAILSLCDMTGVQQEQVLSDITLLSLQGLRILGVAYAEWTGQSLPANHVAFPLKFLGLLGIADPVRPEMREAVTDCYRAGINIKMITGDFALTAGNIAEQIGLKDPHQVITGRELESLSKGELDSVVVSTNVFARIQPHQKLLIVEALKRKGEIVGMTGDGVNDAPALKAAHIGIAMGQRGTDVARAASSIVLMDDNFASIVSGIRMGRRIFDNLTKVISYIIAIHIPTILLVLIPVIFSQLPILLAPVHIVFLVMDPICTIVFEGQEEEHDIMKQPPRDRNKNIVTGKSVMRSILEGLSITVMVWAIYFASTQLGLSEGQVRALCFTTLVVANMFLALTNLSRIQTLFSIIRRPSLQVKLVLGIALLLMAVILASSYTRGLFQFQVLQAHHLLLAIVGGFISILPFELRKLKWLVPGNKHRELNPK